MSTGKYTKALILMKAMPPTVGHRRLIEWASHLADEVTVLIDTAPDEPMILERVLAVEKIQKSLYGNHELHHAQVVNQDPEAEGFWDEWRAVLAPYKGYDYVVASEPYGQTVADVIGARFMPYDPKRELNNSKATMVRDDPLQMFSMVAPEFKPYLKTVVTIFGAESTGKTTLAKDIQFNMFCQRAFEWARPYLETVGKEITREKMEDIWHGQFALQQQAKWNWNGPNSHLLIQDTDLYSTIGYWEQPHWEKELGPVPNGLYFQAEITKSDLYIITRSNIPFEPDDIRYGIDKRESPDEYWIKLADEHNLNYIILDSNDREDRLYKAIKAILPVRDKKLNKIKYDRGGL